jgi:hypothetical protein
MDPMEMIAAATLLGICGVLLLALSADDEQGLW